MVNWSEIRGRGLIEVLSRYLSGRRRKTTNHLRIVDIVV